MFAGVCAPLQDAATRNAMAGQEEVSQSLASAQARIKVLEANLAEAHATVRHISLQQQLPCLQCCATYPHSSSYHVATVRHTALQQQLP